MLARRLLSLVLLAAVVLPAMAPALALAQDPDSGLPACCRRHGQHHCSMSMEQMARMSHSSSQPQIGTICPCYPGRQVAPVTGAHLLALHAPQQAAVFSAALAPAPRAQTHGRISPERSRYKRGPPSLSIA
jgi:hypothetical protein